MLNFHQLREEKKRAKLEERDETKGSKLTKRLSFSSAPKPQKPSPEMISKAAAALKPQKPTVETSENVSSSHVFRRHSKSPDLRNSNQLPPIRDMSRHLNYSNEKNPSASSQRDVVDEPQIIIQSRYDLEEEEELQCIPLQERNVAPQDHFAAVIDPPKLAVSKAQNERLYENRERSTAGIVDNGDGGVSDGDDVDFSSAYRAEPPSMHPLQTCDSINTVSSSEPAIPCHQSQRMRRRREKLVIDTSKSEDSTSAVVKARNSPPRLSRRRERFTRQKKNLSPSRFAAAGKVNDKPAPAPDEVPAGDLSFDFELD